MNGILEDLKETFVEGSVTVRLIYVNLGVFLVVLLSGVLSATMGLWNILDILWMPTYLSELVYKPWTMLTYMFTHKDFIHVLFNMMGLYWFGKLVGEMMGEKLVLRLYIYGGLAGAIACLLWSMVVSPMYSNMLGASASVLALIAAVATYYPNHYVMLAFIGRVKLKYYALFFVVMYLSFVLDGSSNLGGNVAHVGGMFIGFLMASIWKRSGMPRMDDNSWTERLFARKDKKSKMKVVYGRPLTDMEYNERKNNRNREIDRILDKIKESGYDSLTESEKKTLFEESGK